jgi:hypothetical protein
MQKIELISGRVIYTSKDTLYLSKGPKLFSSVDSGKRWQLWLTLPVNFWVKILMSIPFLSRLFRLHIHHLSFLDNQAVVFINNESFLVKNSMAVSLGVFQGSRPMLICSSKKTFYYGEYRSNSERSKIHIYRLDFDLQKWVIAWHFTNVRHVHGIFHDPFTDSIWVTTGDSNEEASIWRTDDDFSTLINVLGGSQQYRAVQLLFTSTHIYFGSDAPSERNNLYRISRSDKSVELLSPVGGSVFYGCIVSSHIYFSTAVEPSIVNNYPYSEVWCSKDGVHWKKIFEYKKDFLSMRFFQYGQVYFPAGAGSGGTLFMSPFSTQMHGTTISVPVKC